MTLLKNKFMTMFALGLVVLLALKTGDVAAAEEVAKSFNPAEMQQYSDMASSEAGNVTGGFFLTDIMLSISVVALAAVIYVAFV